MVDSQEEEWMSNEEERARERDLRGKQERGETLTREEAGFLGAVASRRATAGEREEARERGKEKEFKERHKVRSWTSDPEHARAPTPSKETRERVREIREKRERGETLTREEAGTLGGYERATSESRH